MPLFIYTYIVCAFLASGTAWASAAADEGGPAGPRPSTYQDFVNAVGFDVRTIAQNAQNTGQAVNLGIGAGHAFMNAAFNLKGHLEGQGKNVRFLYSLGWRCKQGILD